MPYKRFKRKFRRLRRRVRRFVKRYKRYRRNNTRRFRRNKITTTRIRPILISDKLFVRLKYTIDEPYTPTGSGAITWRIIRANNPSDPDTVSAVQPTGWDQWSAFYQNYRVPAVKVDVTWSMNQDTLQTYYYIMPSLTSVPSTATTFNPEQQPWTRWKRVTNIVTGQNPKTVRMSYFFRQKQMFPAITTYQSSFQGDTGNTTGPLNVYYLALGTRANDATPGVELRSYTVTYYIQFFTRKQQDVS